MDCMDLGENRFLFTFYLASEKWCTLEEGPWMALEELVVMVDFDVSKTVDELEFVFTLIWVHKCLWA